MAMATAEVWAGLKQEDKLLAMATEFGMSATIATTGDHYGIHTSREWDTLNAQRNRIAALGETVVEVSNIVSVGTRYAFLAIWKRPVPEAENLL